MDCISIKKYNTLSQRYLYGVYGIDLKSMLSNIIIICLRYCYFLLQYRHVSLYKRTYRSALQTRMKQVYRLNNNIIFHVCKDTCSMFETYHICGFSFTTSAKRQFSQSFDPLHTQHSSAYYAGRSHSTQSFIFYHSYL